MSGKQMEGDNQRRRTLARRARERGRRPSEAGVAQGAAKQFEHVDTKHRSGPPPAGARKPGPRGGGPTPPPPESRPAPRFDPTALPISDLPGAGLLRYRELVAEVARRAGLDAEQARRAAEATVVALARALDDTDRQRLLAAVPPALRNDFPVVTPRQPRDLIHFLDDVARMTLHSREQARYRAQATLSAIAEQDQELMETLRIPSEIRELVQPPPPGGGVVERTGHTPVLTDEEVRAALAQLPYWSGSRQALTRTLVLPPGNLERVLGRLERLRQQTGRAPHIARQGANSAIITVRTHSVRAVTALDLDLARAVDAAIEEAAAGIA